MFILRSKQDTNTLCGHNVEFFNVKPVVHIVTSGLCRVKINSLVPYCHLSVIEVIVAILSQV
jgi:hypothetical protein